MNSLGKICRTCLGSDRALINLFDYDGILPGCDTKVSLHDILLAVSHVEIRRDDGMPNEICHDCLEKASLAYQFRLSCRRSDDVLRKLPLLQTAFDETTTTTDIPVLSLAEEPEPKNEFSDSFSTNDLIEHLYFRSLPQIDNFPPADDIDCFDDVQIETDDCDALGGTVANLNEVVVECESAADNRAKHACPLCDKTYSLRYYLDDHMKSSHAENRAHLCSECGKRFASARSLRDHLRYHGEKRFACGECDKRYFDNRRLREHAERVHGAKTQVRTQVETPVEAQVKAQVKAFVCEECGKRFTRAAYLRAHLQRAHADDEASTSKPFVCNYDGCERAYAASASLVVHVRQRHTLERPFACGECGKAFGKRSALTVHERLHTGADRQECNLCGRQLTNKKSLKNHVRLHTGERPYRCQACGESFISSVARKEHVMSRHTERLHECARCKKRFHLPRMLHAHMRVHSKKRNLGEAPVATTTTTTTSEAPTVDAKQKVPEPGFEVIV